MNSDLIRLKDLVDDYAKEVGEVAALLPTGYERQWSPARVQTRVGDPPQHADPTGETATDPRRLRLRAEVVAAEREIVAATAVLRSARKRLRHALDDWALGT